MIDRGADRYVVRNESKSEADKNKRTKDVKGSFVVERGRSDRIESNESKSRPIELESTGSDN